MQHVKFNTSLTVQTRANCRIKFMDALLGVRFVITFESPEIN